jgi:uncharacterized membrane protein YkvA (DUF1232 family)
MAKLRPAAAVAGPVAVGLIPGIFRFFRDPSASLPGKAFVLLTIAYILFPADAVPDVIPIVGWLDDLGLAGVAFAYLHRVSGRYRLSARPNEPALEAKSESAGGDASKR